MKILDNPLFSQLGAALSGEAGDGRLYTRLESYSCKMAGQDKKLYKEMSSEPNGTADMNLLSSVSGSPGSWQNSSELYASHYGMPPQYGAVWCDSGS